MWLDYNLIWDPLEYGGIKVVRLPYDAIWKPDILLYNKWVHCFMVHVSYLYVYCYAIIRIHLYSQNNAQYRALNEFKRHISSYSWLLPRHWTRVSLCQWSKLGDMWLGRCPTTVKHNKTWSVCWTCKHGAYNISQCTNMSNIFHFILSFINKIISSCTTLRSYILNLVQTISHVNDVKSLYKPHLKLNVL